MNKKNNPVEMGVHQIDQARELAGRLADLLIGHLIEETIERIAPEVDPETAREHFKPLLELYRTSIYRDWCLPTSHAVHTAVMQLVRPLGMPFHAPWKDDAPSALGDAWWNGVMDWYTNNIQGVENARLGAFMQIPEVFVLHMAPIMRRNGLMGPWPLPQMIATRTLDDITGVRRPNWYLPNTATEAYIVSAERTMLVHMGALEWMMHCASVCERHIQIEREANKPKLESEDLIATGTDSTGA